MAGFLLNVLFFFVVYLPAVAVSAFVVESVAFGVAESDAGLNPILWILFTAPWNLPAVVTVPLLHTLAVAVSKHSGPARIVALLGVPIVFLAVYLLMWGPENFVPVLVLPVAAGGLVYGSLLRVPAPEVHAGIASRRRRT